MANERVIGRALGGAAVAGAALLGSPVGAEAGAGGPLQISALYQNPVNGSDTSAGVVVGMVNASGGTQSYTYSKVSGAAELTVSPGNGQVTRLDAGNGRANHGENLVATFEVDDGVDTEQVVFTSAPIGVPVVTEWLGVVSEAAANGTVVRASGWASDQAGGQLSYALTGGTGQSIFAVDANTGEITVLDTALLSYYEALNGVLTLAIEVTSPTNRTTSITWQILVLSTAGANAKAANDGSTNDRIRYPAPVPNFDATQYFRAQLWWEMVGGINTVSVALRNVNVNFNNVDPADGVQVLNAMDSPTASGTWAQFVQTWNNTSSNLYGYRIDVLDGPDGNPVSTLVEYMPMAEESADYAATPNWAFSPPVHALTAPWPELQALVPGQRPSEPKFSPWNATIRGSAPADYAFDIAQGNLIYSLYWTGAANVANVQARTAQDWLDWYALRLPEVQAAATAEESSGNTVWNLLGNEWNLKVMAENLGYASVESNLDTIPDLAELFVVTHKKLIEDAYAGVAVTPTIILGSAVKADEPATQAWIAAFLAYEIQGTVWPDYNGQTVEELIDGVAIHYTLDNDAWADGVDWLLSLINRGLAVIDTEEIGNLYALPGVGLRGALAAIRNLGRYWDWVSKNNIRTNQTLLTYWGYGAAQHPDEALADLYARIGPAQLRAVHWPEGLSDYANMEIRLFEIAGGAGHILTASYVTEPRVFSGFTGSIQLPAGTLPDGSYDWVEWDDTGKTVTPVTVSGDSFSVTIADKSFAAILTPAPISDITFAPASVTTETIPNPPLVVADASLIDGFGAISAAGSDNPDFGIADNGGTWEVSVIRSLAAGVHTPTITLYDSIGRPYSKQLTVTASNPALNLTLPEGEATELETTATLAAGDSIWFQSSGDVRLHMLGTASATVGGYYGGNPGQWNEAIIPTGFTGFSFWPVTTGSDTTIAVRDGDGGTWSVVAGGSIPTWSAHPSNQSITEPALFTLSATPVDYDSVIWQKEDSVGAGTYTDIAGETGLSLTNYGPNFNLETGILYRLSATNATGTSYSNPAAITIAALAPPTGFVAGDLKFETHGLAIQIHDGTPTSNPADADVWFLSGPDTTFDIPTATMRGSAASSYLRGNGFVWPDMAGFGKTAVAWDLGLQVVVRRTPEDDAVLVRIDCNFDSPYVAGANSGNIAIDSQTVGTLLQAIYTAGGAATSLRGYVNLFPNRAPASGTPHPGAIIDLVRLYGAPA